MTIIDLLLESELLTAHLTVPFLPSYSAPKHSLVCWFCLFVGR